MLMEEMSWDEVNAQANAGKIVIVVFGAFEAHGKHLPLNTDTFIPYEIGRRVSEKTGALLFPPINLGFCYTLRRFPGTVSLSSSTLSAVAFDVFSELVRNGFTKFLVINGHGGNGAIVKNTLKEMADDYDFKAAVVSWWDLLDVDTGHADENEASVLVALGEAQEGAGAGEIPGLRGICDSCSEGRAYPFWLHREGGEHKQGERREARGAGRKHANSDGEGGFGIEKMRML